MLDEGRICSIALRELTRFRHEIRRIEVASDMLSAVVLGIVEGLTEFLPVSSTGHLILFGDAIGFKGPRAETFEIFIQLGAILAVVVLYFPRFLALLDFNSTNGFSGREGLIKLAVGCLPAFVLGALLHDQIKEHLFGPVTVAAALIIGALMMIVVERKGVPSRTRTVEEVSYKQALVIGCVQCLALWPGMSRSASTIIGGMLVGLDRKIAAEFSFLLAVPVMAAAVSFDLLKSYRDLAASDFTLFGVGFLVSFIVAALAIRFFLGLLNRFTLEPFAYYRIALGTVVIITLLY